MQSNLPDVKPGGNGQATDVTPSDPAKFAGRETQIAAPDPFDPANLRLSQDFGATIGVKKVLTTVPCRKPQRAEWVRVRPGDDWRLETAALEDKINRETFLVARTLVQELGTEVSRICLFLTINRQNDVYLWPTKLPGADGRTNSWNESAMAAARTSKTQWVRVAANMGASMYDVYTASGELAEPVWPELTFPEILRLAFKDRFISSHDHPVLRALRGEV